LPGDEQLSKDLTLADFTRFRDYIHQHSGIWLEESKLDSLRISLYARATRLELTTWDDYFATLSRDDAEFRELMSLITINETSFFRFPQQFDALRTHVLPEIMGDQIGENRIVRVWSAGCSTGEEPYTIGMALFDSGIETLDWRYEVMGTDVSTKALGVARGATYPGRALGGLSTEIVSRHFVRVGEDEYRVAPHVRKHVGFGYHNLIKEPYPLSLMGNWDIIFCRNVTIYFRLDSTRRVVSNFYNSLNEGGYLFIGHSETLTSITDQFEPVEVGGVFLYRKSRREKRWQGFSAAGPGVVTGPAAEALRPRRGAALGDGPGEVEREERRTARHERVAKREVERHARADEAAAEATSVADILDLARQRFAEGQPDEVLRLIDLVLGHDRGNADAHLLTAYVFADSGDYDAALDACTRALAVNPLMPGARYILGVIYQRQGDLVRAVSELKKTVYIDSDFALAHLNLGNIYKQQGRFDAAAREYENTLKSLYVNPEGDWVHFLGGWKADVLLRTCERSLLECRKAMGIA
jgi:chemotaxis protein methyltransferase CheR